jgi:pentapeptide MXKDX repeat protein
MRDRAEIDHIMAACLRNAEELLNVQCFSSGTRKTQHSSVAGYVTRCGLPRLGLVTLPPPAHPICAPQCVGVNSRNLGGFMKKMIGRLMAMCLVAVSLAAFAQSGDNMKQDSMKHDDMNQDQMKNDSMKKDEMKKDKKSKKTKKDKMKKDDMKKDDGMKHDDAMKQN